jgi:hypothetical protein
MDVGISVVSRSVYYSRIFGIFVLFRVVRQEARENLSGGTGVCMCLEDEILAHLAVERMQSS